MRALPVIAYALTVPARTCGTELIVSDLEPPFLVGKDKRPLGLPAALVRILPVGVRSRNYVAHCLSTRQFPTEYGFVLKFIVHSATTVLEWDRAPPALWK